MSSPSLPLSTSEPVQMQRGIRVPDSALDHDARRVKDVSFSSEAPVDRGSYIEVLDHSPGAVDLSRMQKGAPLLKDHDLQQQLGTVDDSRHCTISRRCYASAEFDQTEFAKQEWQETARGHRSNYSFGYSFKRSDCQVTKGADKPVVRVLRWQPYELTVATVPLDHSIGLARAAEINPEIETLSFSEPAPNLSQPPDSMSEQTVEITPQATESRGITAEERTAIINEYRSEAQRRSETLDGIHVTLSRSMSPQAATDWLAPFRPGGRREKEAVEQIVYEMQSLPEGDPGKRGAVAPSNRFEEDIDIPEKEARSWSFFQALEESLENGGRPQGLTRELTQERARLCGREPKGFFLPTAGDLKRAFSGEARELFDERQHQARATLATGTFSGYTDASALKPLDHRDDEFIEFLRPNTVFDILGSRMITGITGGDLDIPRQNAGASAAFKLEDADTAQSEATFDNITLTPKEATVYSQYTRKMLRQSAPSVEQAVRQDLNDAISVLVETKGFQGDETSNPEEPDGILNATGILTSSIASAGQPTWAELVEFESDVEGAHAMNASFGYVTTFAVKTWLKTNPQISGAHPFLWEKDNTINGYPAIATSHMPSNGILAGAFNDHLIAIWSGVDVVIDETSQLASRIIRFAAHMMLDMDVRHAASFSKNA